MGTKFLRGMTTGALIGIAAGMMMVPSMDRGTKRKMKRAGKMVRGTAEDMYDSVREMMMR